MLKQGWVDDLKAFVKSWRTVNEWLDAAEEVHPDRWQNTDHVHLQQLSGNRLANLPNALSRKDMVDPDDVKDVLAVIGLYEDGSEDCNNAVLDHETGLDPATVDAVLEYLWESDQIEGILTLGGRRPSLDSLRRVLPDRDRLWGEDGRYRHHQ